MNFIFRNSSLAGKYLLLLDFVNSNLFIGCAVRDFYPHLHLSDIKI